MELDRLSGSYPPRSLEGDSHRLRQSISNSAEINLVIRVSFADCHLSGSMVLLMSVDESGV